MPSLVERKARFAVLLRNKDHNATLSIEPLPAPARKSIISDREVEFQDWRNLTPVIGTMAEFCNPLVTATDCLEGSLRH